MHNWRKKQEDQDYKKDQKYQEEQEKQEEYKMHGRAVRA